MRYLSSNPPRSANLLHRALLWRPRTKPAGLNLRLGSEQASVPSRPRWPRFAFSKVRPSRLRTVAGEYGIFGPTNPALCREPWRTELESLPPWLADS